MTVFFASILVFSLSFIALVLGIKDSPRARLFEIYSEKKDLAMVARENGDLDEYHRLSSQSRDAYEMMRRLDCYKDANDWRKW